MLDTLSASCTHYQSRRWLVAVVIGGTRQRACQRPTPGSTRKTQMKKLLYVA